MTIFRCELIDIKRLTYQLFSANDPDIICVEVALDGNVLIDVSMDASGHTSILFDEDGGQMEFELGGLRQVLDKCESELEAWRGRLTEPGQIWSNDR